MVQVDNTGLDELILQIFEEQEELFSFPVQSQKEAKAFVRALNTKGLPYEVICQEIGEYEHNFASWRKSLGRIGIGNRVIKLINRQFLQLLEDSDASDQSEEEDMEEDEDEEYEDEKESNGYQQLTSETRETSSLTRHPGQTNESFRASVLSKEQEVNTKVIEKEINNKVNDAHQSRHNDDNAATYQSKTSAENTKVLKSIPPPESNSNAKMTASMEKVVTPPSEFCDQAVKAEARHTQPAHESSSDEDDDEDVKMSVAERIKSINSGTPIMKRRSQHRDSESESPVPRSPVMRRRSPTPDSTPDRPTSQHSSSDQNERPVSKVEELLHKFDDITESFAPESPKHSSHESKSESPAEVKPTTAKTPQADPEPLTVQAEPITAKSAPTTAQTPPTTPRDKYDGRASSTSEEKPTSVQKTEMKLETRSDSVSESISTPDSTCGSGLTSPNLDGIDENYNSDLDPENEDQSPVMAKLVQKISGMRGNTKNTAGFLYVFSDSLQPDESFRIKVGASRCPHKRLRQAQMFNPNIYQVLTIPVTQRLTVLNALTDDLNDYRLASDAKNWYAGPKEELLSVINAVSERYPSKTIQQRPASESVC